VASVTQTFGPWPAVVLDVHDGDTMTLVIDLGFDLTIRMACRIHGINAPELRTQEGKDARAFALTLVQPGDAVRVVSKGWDKYGGRFDGIVWLADGREFNATMLETGHAEVLNIR
jgi:micrococcal nuclease